MQWERVALNSYHTSEFSTSTQNVRLTLCRKTIQKDRQSYKQRSGPWVSSAVASEMALGLPPVTPFASALDRGMASASRRRRADQQKRWREVGTCVPTRRGGETDANNKSYISARFLKNTRWAG
jgi:hypothetical protein